MALDTTIGGASADSYVSAADFAAYVVANISATYSGVEATQEVNLRRAAQWIDSRYDYTGTRQYETQARTWPRVTGLLVDGWPINADTVPQDIKNAQCELAYLIETDSLNPFATVEATVKRSRSKAGPVETETEYTGGKSSPRIVAIEVMLRRYTEGGSAAQFRMQRA